MKEFKGDDLSSVNRVIVDVGNPLARTTAGRVQMAEQMLQMGAIKDAQQYFTIINTGKLDVMTEGSQAQLMLIKGENERMLEGEEVPTIAIDDHQTHIIEHGSILSDPDLRKDQALVKLVLDHIQGHITALQTTDPNLLKLLHQTPLPPPGPPQGAPSGPMGASPMPAPGPQGPPAPGSPSAQGLVPPKQSVGPSLVPVAPGTPLPGLPSIPKPPKPFEHNPTNPANIPVGR
jgi:hypothetical protein